MILMAAFLAMMMTIRRMNNNKKLPVSTNLYCGKTEETLLGLLIFANDECDTVAQFLQPEHFFVPFHQKLYAHILVMNEKNIPIDVPSINYLFKKDSQFAAKSEKEIIQHIFGLKDIGRSAGAKKGKDLAIAIINMYISRKLEELCLQKISDLQAETCTYAAPEHVENLSQKSYVFRQNLEEAAKIKTLSDALRDLRNLCDKVTKIIATGSSVTALPTGFKSLDDILGGLCSSQLIILGARPSMGKTAMALNLAVTTAKFLNYLERTTGGKHGSVLFISLEMSVEQICMRMISMETGIPLMNLRRGIMTNEERRNMNTVLPEKMQSIPILFPDYDELSITSLCELIRDVKRNKNVRCVFIDYLQLIHYTGKRQYNKANEVAEITGSLKDLAKELDIPIVVLSQLSRAVEQRDYKLPQLSDLRESGSIEQDADVVMFLYREAYYEERKIPKTQAELDLWVEKMRKIYNQADLIISKNRNGPIGNIKLFFNPMTMFFSDFKF